MSDSGSCGTNEDMIMEQTKGHVDKPSNIEAGRTHLERVFAKQ